MSEQIKQARVEEQIEGCVERVMEEVREHVAGFSMSAGALGLDETETDQAVVDLLGVLRDEIQDLRRETGREALREGRHVFFPS